MKHICPLLLLVLFTSCKKSNMISTVDFSFPDKIGYHWLYQYNDGYTQRLQYISVDIVADGRLPNGEFATVWATNVLDSTGHNPNLIDSTYVVADGQTVIFYDAPCWTCTTQMPAERRRYVFPLRVNNKWFSSAFYGDTTKVLSEGVVSVPAGAFPNSFELSKKVGYVTNSFTLDTIWLSTGIGMTKYSQDEYSLGPLPGNGVWELTDYSLK